MKRTTAIRALSTTLIGVGVISLARKARFENTVSQSIQDLHKEVRSRQKQSYSREELEGLPAPVRHYFENVLTDGQPYVDSVQLRQRGEFKLGNTEDSWKPLQASQHFSVNPPGFVWDAHIKMFPFVSARVLDMYQKGKGTLQARVLSAFSVARAGPSPEMNAGELLRYLAESIWFPTALLPSAGVEWEAIDEQSARATLEDSGNSASLVFYFNDEDEIERVYTDRRYRQEDSSYQPWTGYFHNYQVKNGMRIPFNAEVEWNLSSGNNPYWRAHINEIQHTVANESN